MRKLAFVKKSDDIQKVMIYASDEGVYLFGYDCLQDAECMWDNWYQTVEIAEEYCADIYEIHKEDWIEIQDPSANCQHDYISKVRIKGRDSGNPTWGQIEKFENGKWIDADKFEKQKKFGALTVNERLYITGLIDEYYNSLKDNRENAFKILKGLGVDEESIKKIASQLG